MNVGTLMPAVGGIYTRALVLEQLHYWQERTTERDEQGRPVMVLLLRSLGERLNRTKGALSKALHWLADQGFIAIQRIKRGRAYRLQVRLLVRLRKRSAETQETVRQSSGNGQETANKYSSMQENTSLIRRAPSDTSGPRKRPALSGSVKDAEKRLAEKTSLRRREEEKKTLTPTRAAHEWNRLLREYGDAPFPLDRKHLSHVKTTLKRVNASSLDEFVARLRPAIEWWFMNREQDPKHKHQSAHPWVLNRHHAQAFAPPPAPQATVPEPAPEPTPSPVAKMPDPAPQPKKTGMVHLFTQKKKKYGPNTSNTEG